MKERKKTKQNFSKLISDVSYKHQLEYAKKIGFGSTNFEIIEVEE